MNKPWDAYVDLHKSLPGTGPCTLLSLRDQWGYPLLWDQPDGERWRTIFETSTHWFRHAIQLSYPDGTMVILPGRMPTDGLWHCDCPTCVYTSTSRWYIGAYLKVAFVWRTWTKHLG